MKNWTSKIWNGNESLPRMYWVYNILGGIIGQLACALATLSGVATIMFTVGVLAIVYGIFITVGLWRSAQHYTDNNPSAWWGIVVQVLIVFSIVIQLLRLVSQ